MNWVFSIVPNGLQLPVRAGLNNTNFQNSNTDEDSTNVH